ncbi:ProQ/FinO family protein [Paraburkholderia sp. LEh10]|uniref:ProQ/FinO family protein n=1 Tax=Paraburkholderia sp. LEh10 TaxID=2821353 RepID=UPI001AE4A9A6|nr:ProQ/FinO family protein [Paraburkholderia sp. LEh10]MBP0594801.1 ProQ/FinO family protein [Paraburkholderia sp. LEh10]
MGFEQLAKLRDQLAKQANAQRKQKQASERHPSHAGDKDAKAKDTKARDAKPAARTADRPAAKTGARKPEHARPAARQNQNPVDPVVHTIGKLQKRFPLAFPKNPAPKVALKIGILEDLLAQAGELKLTEQEIRDAVSTWCRGSRYWASLTEGAPRVDLAGAETGKVTAADSAFARRRSSGGRTRPAKANEEAAAAAKTGDEDASTAGDKGNAPEADQAQG